MAPEFSDIIRWEIGLMYADRNRKPPVSPESDSRLIQSLLSLDNPGVNSNLLGLYDEEFSPDSMDSFQADPFLILAAFQPETQEEYPKSAAYGFAGAVIGWMESLLTSEEEKGK